MKTLPVAGWELEVEDLNEYEAEAAQCGIPAEYYVVEGVRRGLFVAMDARARRKGEAHARPSIVRTAMRNLREMYPAADWGFEPEDLAEFEAEAAVYRVPVDYYVCEGMRLAFWRALRERENQNKEAEAAAAARRHSAIDSNAARMERLMAADRKKYGRVTARAWKRHRRGEDVLPGEIGKGRGST